MEPGHQLCKVASSSSSVVFAPIGTPNTSLVWARQNGIFFLGFALAEGSTLLPCDSKGIETLSWYAFHTEKKCGECCACMCSSRCAA